MVGSTKDPDDGKAVAASVFAAVIVYAVRTFPCPFFSSSPCKSGFPFFSASDHFWMTAGVPGLLRLPSIITFPGQ